MARTLSTLVKKEVRDLVKDRKLVVGMIIVPLVIFPLMGVAINQTEQSAITASQSSSFGLMNLDGGNYSLMAADYFASLPNTTVKLIPAQSVPSAMNAAAAQGLTSLVVIPADFSSDVSAQRQASLQTYSTVTGFGIAGAASGSRLGAVVNSFGTVLSAYYVKTQAPGLNYSVVAAPVALNQSTFINGDLVSEAPEIVASQGLSQSLALPIATFVVLIFAMQIASTAMAVEKEQKTFETLLTLPVSRFQILTSKLLGSAVIAALGAVASLVGFTYYYTELTQGASTGVAIASLTPSVTYYVVLGILMFLTLTLATAIAIIVSVFAADVRGAQAIVGYFAFPIMVPALLIILTGFETLSPTLQAVVLAIPFSYTAIFSSTGLFGVYTYALIGMAYLVVWIVGTLYLGSRFFNSERVLTARFSFGRKKKGPPPS